MAFREKYTTDELKKKEPEKEKDKTVVSPDTYALCETLEDLRFFISRMGLK